MGPLVVILFRVFVPLLIFKFPFLGALLSMELDNLDYNFLSWFNRGSFPDYQATDKLLDLYYLTFEACMVLFWKNAAARKIAWGLFLYRTLGVLLFEFTGYETLLFFFPNIFEFYYLFYIGYRKLYGRDFNINWRLTTTTIFILASIKFYQEYNMHVVHQYPWNQPQEQIISALERTSNSSKLAMHYWY